MKHSFIPGKTIIEVAKKTIGSQEINAAIAAVRDCQWSAGKYVKQFEQNLAKCLGRKYALTTNSGSSANLLAITALTSPILGKNRLRPGDEVITVAAGFPTTVNPIIQNQLIPVFVDIDLSTLNLNPASLSKALTRSTRAVVLAHTLGNPFDIASVVKFCQQHHLYLIEDNCDSLGSSYKGKPTGSFGDLSTHSFYPAHHITMGEGGAVVTNNSKLAEIVQALRDWGRYLSRPLGKTSQLPADYDQRYTFYEIGYNCKITEMQAAIGLAQLTKLPRFTHQRIANSGYLFSRLKDLPYLILHQATPKSVPSWFGFPITVDLQAPFSRQTLIKHLHHHQIDTRLLLAGNLTKQPYFLNHKFPYRIAEPLTNTDLVMKQTFWIGCAPSLNQMILAYVVKTIKKFIDHYVA